jgi:hypothetical protein
MYWRNALKKLRETMMLKDIGILLFAALIIALIVFGPFITIWAMNTVFPVLTIPYTFDTWCATVILAMFLKGNAITLKK